MNRHGIHAPTTRYSTFSSDNATNMSLKSRSINWVPHQRPALLREDFHHPQPFRRRGRGRKIVVTGLRVARSKQPGGILTAIGNFVSFHADVS